MREQFDTIYDSLVNGQRRQAVEQMRRLDSENIPAMLDYFNNDLNQPEMAIEAAKAWFYYP